MIPRMPVVIWTIATASACAVADRSFALDAAPAADSQQYAFHGQFTYVEQETGSFASPYRGANSLSPDSGRETIDATLFMGRALWPGAELWVNTEIDQGFGLDDTLGAAWFPSGEAYKVGKKEPYLRLSRLFVRQAWNLGTSTESVEAAANQLGGMRSADRVVLTVGKFGVGDVFDTNQYAHDPRGDFLNWSALDAASFDYAADAWGYTVGASLEWYSGPWTYRAGLFDLSDVPNSPHLEPGGHEFQEVIEIERRYDLGGHTGRALLTGYESRARMGLLSEAVRRAEATGDAVDIAAVRSFRTRTGLSLAVEQQLATDVGMFARAGRASGNVEVYEFTDADSTAGIGLSLRGVRWNRPHDTFAVAAIENEISSSRQRFLAAGGLGLLIGDGQLPHPAPERIIETYYDCGIAEALHITLDFQRIANPAYNRDRGPVPVFAIRVHSQF